METWLMRLRIEQELALLRRQFPDIEHLEHAGEDWFHLPRYAFPGGWRMHQDAIEFAPIVFRVGAGYPTTEPYAFCAPAGINYLGATPGNLGAASGVPIGGNWQQFSWAPDASWAPTQHVHTGSNLLSWTRSFACRLKEGA
jgi:hypothetical protein